MKAMTVSTTIMLTNVANTMITDFVIPDDCRKLSQKSGCLSSPNVVRIKGYLAVVTLVCHVGH